MPRNVTHPCTACEQTFGSKWALDEHQKTCPVRRLGDLKRVQEALEWKKGRIEQSIGECYRYAARSFATHHQVRPAEAVRFLDWLEAEVEQVSLALEDLNQALAEANQPHFPRLTRLRTDVGLLMEQVKDLSSITRVLIGLLKGG